MRLSVVVLESAEYIDNPGKSESMFSTASHPGLRLEWDGGHVVNVGPALIPLANVRRMVPEAPEPTLAVRKMPRNHGETLPDGSLPVKRKETK